MTFAMPAPTAAERVAQLERDRHRIETWIAEGKLAFRDRNPGATHPDIAGKVLELDPYSNLARMEWSNGQLGFIVASRLEPVSGQPADLFGARS